MFGALKYPSLVSGHGYLFQLIFVTVLGFIDIYNQLR